MKNNQIKLVEDVVIRTYNAATNTTICYCPKNSEKQDRSVEYIEKKNSIYRSKSMLSSGSKTSNGSKSSVRIDDYAGALANPNLPKIIEKQQPTINPGTIVENIDVSSHQKEISIDEVAHTTKIDMLKTILCNQVALDAKIDAHIEETNKKLKEIVSEITFPLNLFIILVMSVMILFLLF